MTLEQKNSEQLAKLQQEYQTMVEINARLTKKIKDTNRKSQNYEKNILPAAVLEAKKVALTEYKSSDKFKEDAIAEYISSGELEKEKANAITEYKSTDQFKQEQADGALDYIHQLNKYYNEIALCDDWQEESADGCTFKYKQEIIEFIDFYNVPIAALCGVLVEERTEICTGLYAQR